MTRLRIKRFFYRAWLRQLVVWDDMGRSHVWWEDGGVGYCPSRESDRMLKKIEYNFAKIEVKLNELHNNIKKF